MDTSILNSLIAAGAATGGILVKMAYDASIESLKAKRETTGKFAEERKRLYDEFLELHKEELKYQKGLQELTLIARAGKEVKEEIIAEFPQSPLPALVDVLDKMRRVTHTHEIVKVGERIVALHGDASTALRYFMMEESAVYGLPLFLCNKLGEDQALEFISIYRKDLGIGIPKGAEKSYPVIDRGWPIVDAEQQLRRYLRSGIMHTSDFSPPANSDGRLLTEGDRRLLESPRFRVMIRSEPNSS
jgi:hypothetical protein